MSEAFQLVLIDGITDRDGPLEGTNDTISFFSSSFPTADIVWRQFPDTSPGQPLTSTDLHQQASLIGRELIGKPTMDDNGRECPSQSKDAPLIFIGHDTGGCLIKQVLLLAREEKMFQSILVRVKGVIFVGTPHKGPDLTIWEHHIICLLGSSSPLPFPSQYLKGLPQQLLDSSEEFAQISWNFEILNIIQARPRLRDFVNLRPRSVVTLHEAFTLLDLPKVKSLRLRCSHAALWQFETGSPMSDTVCKELSGMLGSERSAAQDGFQNFIHRLNQLHPVECGVGTARPAANSLKWVDHDETYKRWKSKDYKGLLHVSGPPGSGTTVLATNLLRSVLEAHKYRQITMLSFGFNMNDIRARSQKSALLSLNRQVLLAHPDLFLFVEPLCDFMLDRNLFNKGVLWSLLRSLLTHLAESKIYCVLYGIHECKESEEITDLVDRLSKIVVASGASINIITTSDDCFAQQYLEKHDTYLRITSGGRHHTALAVEALVRENVARVARQKPLWAEFERNIVDVLCDGRSPSYLLAMHRLAVLESADVRSTKGDFLKKLQPLQSLGKEVPIISSQDYLGDDAWLLSALSWISYSVRPLTIPELSIAVAFDEFRRRRSFYVKNSPTDIDIRPDFSLLLDMVPRDIVGDLSRRIGPLIRVDRNQVLHIHRSFRAILTDAYVDFRGSQANPDQSLFCTCLEYLKYLSMSHIGESHDIQHHGLQNSLLEYAAAYWPEHYKLASRGDNPEANKYIDLFMGDSECISFWADYYRKAHPEDPLWSAFNFDPNRIHIACRFALIEQFQYLQLETIHTTTLRAALNLAATFGYLELVSRLLEHGVESLSALALAAAGKHSPVVSVLLNRNPEWGVWKDEYDNMVLHHAVLGGDRATVEILASRAGSGLNSQNADGYTPLYLAAKTGQGPLVHALVKKNADITLKDMRGMNSLAIATSAGFDEIVDELLNSHADPLDSFTDGNTALHLATCFCHPIIVRRLLEACPQLNYIKNHNGFTPLHIAAKHGYQEILELLLPTKPMENGKTLGHTGIDDGDTSNELPIYLPLEPDSPLQLAITNGHINVVKKLLSHWRHRLEDCCRALYSAVGTGLEDVTEMLLTHTETVDFRDTQECSTVFHQAAVGGSRKVLELLLARRSEITTINTPDHNGKTALHEAATRGWLDIVVLLLESQADVDARTTSDEETPLHLAAYAGHRQVVEELMQQMTDIEKKNSRGKTAFEIAVEREHMEMIIELLHSGKVVGFPFYSKAILGQELVLKRLLESKAEFGWDCNKPKGEDRQKTPLHLAVSWQFIRAVELLQQHEADVNAKTEDGQTPLLVAVHEGSTEIVELLLKLGANIDLQDNLGRTPLYVACLWGDLEMVKKLLENEIKPNVNSDTVRGWVALHAASDEDAKITRLLLDAGADPRWRTKTAGMIPFARACFSDKRIEVVRQYLERPGCEDLPDEEDFKRVTSVHRAAAGGSECIMKLLAQHHANLNAEDEDGTTPFHVAILAENKNIANILLDHRVDVSRRSRIHGTFLMAAASKGYLDIANRLRERQVNVNETSETSVPSATPTQDQSGSHYTALHAAVNNDHPAMVEWLLSHNANANLADPIKGSPLATALTHDLVNKMEIVRKLIVDGKANVNYIGADGCSLLRTAVSKGLAEVTRLLLENGANTDGEVPVREHPIFEVVRKSGLSMFRTLIQDEANFLIRDKFGRTALSVAINTMRDDITEFILSYDERDDKVGINNKDHAGRTPLMLCMLKHTPEPKMDGILEKLLSRVIDIDAQDSQGKTALIYASSCGTAPWVTKLLEADANPLIRDYRERSPLYWSCRRFSPSTVTLKILECLRVKHESDYQAECAAAVSAAIATNRPSYLEILFQNNPSIGWESGNDGWTPSYTAERYAFDVDSVNGETASKIQDFLDKSGSRVETELSILEQVASQGAPKPMRNRQLPKLPSAWSRTDKTPCLIVGPETVITVGDGPLTAGDEWPDATMASVRADFPMAPIPVRGIGNIYYFEVTIEKGPEEDSTATGGKSDSHWGVGFCEEYSRLNSAVGWEDGSWGWHGDDANAFSEDVPKSLGDGFTYKEGNTIGCGINFDGEFAFFTKDGNIIGQLFNRIRGKLYPAISVRQLMKGARVSAKFWTKDSKDTFKFQDFEDPKVQQIMPESNMMKTNGNQDEGSYPYMPDDDDDDGMLALSPEET